MSEEKNEVDYMQPTRFWVNSLEENWPHLNQEFDESMKEVIPLLKVKGEISDFMREKAGIELVDVQVQCNTIIVSLGYPAVHEDDLNPITGWNELYPISIINFVESKAKAGLTYRNYTRKEDSKENLYYRLVDLINSAEILLYWLYPNSERRRVIRYKVFEKNDNRGYYL
ncbi:MAG: hypothetical protein J6N55_06505 [Anaerovibrio sp.]|uniref:hypothetical protein n=1 Tax=Anaerovibrio sp. TaxID=1872532 RepID=UPI001B1719AE|nr:hypothetical protein [Anaerovibrio sp.]MBO6245914.1 hypothetical protein [Anaerovibrio sp.]